ncbi:MAG TPA: response regulator [Telluria sp.]|nr:response regulator [Telluria sp.]
MSDSGSISAFPDWAATDLGPRDGWSHTLRLAVDLVLGSPAPSILVWGKQRIVVYNDAYAALAASRSVRAPGGNMPALWPAPLSSARDALDRALDGHGSVQRGLSVPFVRESGVSMVNLDLYLTPLADDSGAVAGAVCAMAPSAPPREARSAGLRIVVVEDNLDSQYLVCEMLRALGHEVQGVSHGEDALPLLAAAPHDLLFTDVSLPGISGVDLARQAMARHHGLQVIFASGYGDALLRHVEFPYTSLQKPYDLEQLQAVLGKVQEQLAARA